MRQKLLSLSVAALVSVTSIVGCKKDTFNQSTDSNIPTIDINSVKSSTNPFEQIIDSMGIIHNQSLDYTFKKIKNENLFVGLDDSADVDALVFNITVEYLNSRFEYLNVSYSNSFKDNVINAVVDGIDLTANYSDIYKQKYSELINAYYSSTSPANYRNFTDNFLLNNLSLLPAEEQVTFKAAALVSYNSWEYWEENHHIWMAEYNRQNGLPEPTINARDIRSIGRADIEGCVEGAIFGTLSGGLAGGALGASLGAVGNSARRAIWDFIW